jgi:hypothetical protein
MRASSVVNRYPWTYAAWKARSKLATAAMTGAVRR